MASIVNNSGKKQIVNGGDVTDEPLGFTPTVGNHLFLLLAGWVAGVQGTTAVTSTGNTWVEDIEALATVRAWAWANIYSCKVVQATTTVSINNVANAGVYANYIVIEVSGLNQTTHLDQIGSGTGGTSGDALATASGANTTTSGIAFAVCSVSGNDTDANIGDTPPAGFTNLAVNEDEAQTVGFSADYRIYSSSETSSSQWTHDNVTQDEWAAVIATYKDAAGGGQDARKLVKTFMSYAGLAIPFAKAASGLYLRERSVAPVRMVA